jgi:aspartyl/asparaginyl beta-hydroxylase (cupin superfamily)
MSPASAEARTLAQRAREAATPAEAIALWREVHALDPGEPQALAALGHHAFAAGDLQAAASWLDRAARAGPPDPKPWTDLALLHQRRRDTAAEEAALVQALTADPQDLLALFLRARLYERQGRRHEAARFYGATAAVAPPAERLVPELRPALAHAAEYRAAYERDMALFLAAELEPVQRELAGEPLDRFSLSLDILLGRARRFDSQPMRYYFPGLAPVEFFERSDFPWLDAVEAAADEVRAEAQAVLAADEGFAPYIQYGADQPVAQWAELNHSNRWSAFHLIKEGLAVEAHAQRCPRTMAMLCATPQPDQPGRTPVALFSRLQPHTTIPGHVGASNVRLLVHLPLVIPPNCRFRVGNSVRPWVAGKPWVFDDTIEHEAINDSDRVRTILIFDTWHPRITPPERRMITALSVAMNRFVGADSSYSS